MVSRGVKEKGRYFVALVILHALLSQQFRAEPRGGTLWAVIVGLVGVADELGAWRVAVEEAEKCPYPEPEETLTDVYYDPSRPVVNQ